MILHEDERSDNIWVDGVIDNLQIHIHTMNLNDAYAHTHTHTHINVSVVCEGGGDDHNTHSKYHLQVHASGIHYCKHQEQECRFHMPSKT